MTDQPDDAHRSGAKGRAYFPVKDIRDMTDEELLEDTRLLLQAMREALRADPSADPQRPPNR